MYCRLAIETAWQLRAFQKVKRAVATATGWSDIDEAVLANTYLGAAKNFTSLGEYGEAVIELIEVSPLL